MAPHLRRRGARDHLSRDRRGRAGRVAAGRRLRRAVRGDQPLAHHRGDDGDRRRARVGDPVARRRLPRRPPARAHGRDAGHLARLPPHPSLRRRSQRVRRDVGTARPRHRDGRAPAAVHRAAACGGCLPAQPVPG